MKTKTSSPPKQKLRKFEITHIRGRRITGFTTVEATGYSDAEAKAKPELRRLGVSRCRVREITHGNDKNHVRTFRTLRKFSGFTAEVEP